jgi:hypothetical protein
MDILLERLQREIGQSLRGLDAAQTQLRPLQGVDRWSIQQIVEHLMLTYSSTAGVFRTRLAKGTPTKARPNARQRLGQFVLLRIGYLPRGRKAPVGVTPVLGGEALSGAVLTERVAEKLGIFDELAVEAERLFGTRRAISHGVLGAIGAADWRRFHLVHGRHHVRQILAIRAMHGV